MSNNIIEITENTNYTITVDTNLDQNNNNIEIQLSSPPVVGVINNTTVLVSDLPQGYPLDWTTGYLPIARVSGLEIIGESGIGVSNNSGIFTVTLSNPTVYSSDIVDFSSSVSGLIPVKNITYGSGINITNNNGEFIVAVTGQFGLTGEQVDDRVGSLLKPGNYLNLNYNDTNDSLTISVTGVQPSGNYSVIGHSHTINDISNLQNSLNLKAPTSNPTFTGTVGGVTKSMVGLGNVDNTSDVDKPVSSAQSFADNTVASNASLDSTNKANNAQAYAVQRNNHTGTQLSSTISDFNSSVSGLIPIKNIIGSTYLQISSTSGIYTISTIGLQPSGNYSVIGHSHIISDVSGLQSSLDNKQTVGNYALASHTHTSNNITDFNSSVNAIVSGVYSPLISPSFTGIPTAPTASSGTSNTQIANTQFVRNEISSLINSAPSTLDTLNELASALGNDPNFATTIASGLAQKSNVGHTHKSSDITDFNSSVNSLVSGVYAPLNSPAFSGTPTVPTAASGTNTTQIASTQFVRSEISNLLNSAPSTLDTLNELATALGNDPNFATTIASGLAQKSNIGHTHTYSEITNFNSGVSGLLPSVTGTGYVNTNFNNNIYSISVSGLQPSGNYSVVGHTHSSSDITGFNSNVSGLIPVKEIVSGTGISVSSTSGIYTINSTSSGTVAQESAALVATVFNKTGSIIPKFKVVYVNGGQGDQATVTLAQASGEITSSKSYGITAENINNMSAGKVIIYGSLTGLNTDQFNPTAPQGNVNGTVLYLSSTIPGGITTTKPSAPNHLVSIGTIVRTHQNEGVVEVRIQNGFELEELHNVAISGIIDNQIIKYDSSSLLWKNQTLTSSDINNFNSSVSGLLPVSNITASSGIIVSNSGSIYNISSNGLAFTSGANFSNLSVTGVPVSISGHKHVYTDITNWASGIDSTLSTLLIAGNYININYDSTFDTLTIATSGLQPSGNYSLVGHSHSSSDITNFNSSVSGLLPSISGSGYVNSSFNNNTYTISVNGLQPSGNYSLDGHTHTASNITDFNSSVSGILPVKNIIGSGNINVSSSSGSFTISNSGLVKSDTTGITGATAILNIVQISQANYDALGVYDSNTLYVIN